MEIFSLCIGTLSLCFALYTFLKTESLRRRLRIELNRLSDDSHAFLNRLNNSNASEDLKERYSSLNHAIVTHLISIDKRLAQQWINKNKPENEWNVWETNLQVCMKKLRS